MGQVRAAGVVALLGVLAACSGQPTPLPPSSAAQSASAPSLEPQTRTPPATTGPEPSFDPNASGLVSACGGALTQHPHDGPELERQLPTELDGRELSVWSVRARCALELLLGGGSSTVDDYLADLETPGSPPIDLDRIVYAIAGRADTVADPPYFVYAAARPEDEDEISVNLVLLLGGAAFFDVAAAAELEGFERRSIAGKDVFVGTTLMLDQTDHQRGRPYLYQTNDVMFLVVTAEDAWATEAFSKLP